MYYTPARAAKVYVYSASLALTRYRMQVELEELVEHVQLLGGLSEGTNGGAIKTLANSFQIAAKMMESTTTSTTSGCDHRQK